MKSRNFFNLSMIFSILILVYGCGGGAYTWESINVAVTPGVKTEQFGKIKRVVILFREDNSAPGSNNVSSLADILSDNVTIEMMKLGYECIAPGKLKKVLEDDGIKIAEQLDVENAIKAGKKMGVQAIITGNVKSINSVEASRGFGGSSVSSGMAIQSTTLKVFSTESGESLMMISVNYDNGQKLPDLAAQCLVKTLKEKLDKPYENEETHKENQK